MYVRNIVSVLAAASAVMAFPTGPASNHMAALTGMNKASAIKDKYIVVFKDNVSSATMNTHKSAVGHAISVANGRIVARDGASAKTFAGIQRQYETALKGYAGEFDAATLNEIRSKPEVAYVEVDGKKHALATQENAPWGLARISSRKPGGTTYTYDDKAGEGVTVYVIDTGVFIKHSEFEGRATWGESFLEGDEKDKKEDGNGHGTHCAGTIAGKTYGVSKKAKIVAVQVLDAEGSGSDSGVIGGIDWVAKNAEGKKSVASMSLGGSASESLDAACVKLIEAGITLSVAAGNDNSDAKDDSPARVQQAITVGASNKTDEMAYFSNWGSIVDVFAPGFDIESAWIGDENAKNTISGTSMACPHVAGLAAYFISQKGEMSPDEVAKQIASMATTGAITGVGDNSTTTSVIFNGAQEGGKFKRMARIPRAML